MKAYMRYKSVGQKGFEKDFLEGNGVTSPQFFPRRQDGKGILLSSPQAFTMTTQRVCCYVLRMGTTLDWDLALTWEIQRVMEGREAAFMLHRGQPTCLGFFQNRRGRNASHGRKGQAGTIYFCCEPGEQSWLQACETEHILFSSSCDLQMRSPWGWESPRMENQNKTRQNYNLRGKSQQSSCAGPEN